MLGQITNRQKKIHRPGTTIYSASKSFTSKFTTSLQTKLVSPDPAFRSSYTSKIEILHLMPGGVRTKMTPIEATSLSPLDGKAFLVTPAAFAKAVLGKVGLGEYYKSVYPCWRHELQMGVLTTFPEEGGSRAWVNGFLMRGVNGPRAGGWRRSTAGWKMADGKLVEPEKEGQLVDVE